MKKIILSVFAVFGINMAIAQSTTGDNTTTNATSTGHKLEHSKDTTYIPATDGDGSEKHNKVDKSGKNLPNSTDNTTKTKSRPKTKAGTGRYSDTTGTK